MYIIIQSDPPIIFYNMIIMIIRVPTILTKTSMYIYVCVCVCAACVCVRACVRACVRVYVCMQEVIIVLCE